MVFLRFFIVGFIFTLAGCSVDTNQLIKNNYLNKDKPLDKHSFLAQKEIFDKLTIMTDGNYKGIGLKLVKYDSKIYVLDILKNSPAYNKGISLADELIMIDNIKVNGKSLDEIYSIIKNRENKFKLTLKNSDKKLYECWLKNSKITVKNISSKLLQDGTLYIKIKRFQDGTAQKFLKVLKLNPSKSIMIDLRDNKGGLLKEGLKLADIFIKNKILLYEKTRSKTITHYANNTELENYKITIAVNSNTASASEIFAGVMQYYKKATIVGEKTYGKGTIQTLYNVGDNKILKLTTSKYFLPDMSNIDGVGILPDKPLRDIF